MNSKSTLNRQQPAPVPALTAQRSRSNRIQYAGCIVVFLLVTVYAFDSVLQQYSESPTNENLLFVVIVIFSFFFRGSTCWHFFWFPRWSFLRIIW